MIDTTSKIGMKMSCLAACSGDVKRAEEMYQFLADGIDTMPDYTPRPPTIVDQVKQTANEVFTFVKDNQDGIMQAWNYLQAIRSGQPIMSATPTTVTTAIPPLPKS